jgi:hypothetical protein
MSVYRNGAATSSLVLSDWSSIYGRQDATSQCDSQTVTFDVMFSSASLGVIDPNGWLLGDRIVVYIKNAALATATYFSGTVTDLNVNHDVMTVIATSDALSAINRTPIDLGPYVGALTGTVVNAALVAVQAEGALATKTITTAAGTNTVATPALASSNANSFISQVVASEPNGVLLETPSGVIFTDYDSRRISTMPATQKFDLSTFGALIEWDWQLERSVSDFVNFCSVTWTGGTATYSDTASVTAKGAYNRSVSTYIDNVTDADYNALRIVQHGLEPGWRTSGIVLDMSKLSDVNRDAILKNMRTGSYLKIPLLLAGTQTEFFVEGWTDRFVYGPTGARTWFRELYISDINISQAAQRYIDVVSGVTYATVNAAYRWIDLEQQQI